MFFIRNCQTVFQIGYMIFFNSPPTCDHAGGSTTLATLGFAGLKYSHTYVVIHYWDFNFHFQVAIVVKHAFMLFPIHIYSLVKCLIKTFPI
jgi:hypothetical protein